MQIIQWICGEVLALFMYSGWKLWNWGGREGGRIWDLTERAVEDEGVLAAGGPRQLWHPRREPAAGVVERARDVRLVAPLVVPSIPKSQIHGEGQSPNRRRLEQHFTGGGARAYLTSMMERRWFPRTMETSFAADTYDTVRAILTVRRPSVHSIRSRKTSVQRASTNATR
jgi:hypothetical protein